MTSGQQVFSDGLRVRRHVGGRGLAVACGLVIAFGSFALVGCGPDRATRCIPEVQLDDQARAGWPVHAELTTAVGEVATLIAERIDDPGFAVRSTEAWLDEMPERRRELPRAVAAVDRALGERRFDTESAYGRDIAPAMASANAALDAALRALAARDPAAAGYLAGRLVEWLDPDQMIRAGSP